MPPQKIIERAPLGSSGLSVTRIGFGCWALGGHGWRAVDEDEIVKAVREAVSLGVNFFDTADVYGFGRSEELLGRALADSTEETVIATKFGVTWDEQGNIGRNARPEYVRFALEASLKRLRLDRIPLYQIHWPDPDTPIEATIETLLECKREGKIGHIGCSNFSMEEMRAALKLTDIASLQSLYSLIDREVEKDILPLCKERGTGFLAYGTLARGLLTGKFDRDSRFGDDDVRSRDPRFKGDSFSSNLAIARAVGEVAARNGRSAAQTATRWVLENGAVSCAITGIKDRRQLVDNLGSLGWELPAADYAYLNDIALKEKGGSDE